MNALPRGSTELLGAAWVQPPLLILAVMALARAGRLWFVRRSKPEFALR